MKGNRRPSPPKSIIVPEPLPPIISQESISSTIVIAAQSSTQIAAPAQQEGGGDSKNPGPEPQEKRKKSSGYTCRNIFIAYFAIYSIICFGYILATVVIFGLVASKNVKYFIRPPNTTPFFDLETGSTWMATKFLLGSLTHYIISIVATFALGGGKCSQEMISRSLDKARIFQWLAVVATIADVIMLDATLDYVTDGPIVQTGLFRETVLPPPTSIANCLDPRKVQADPDTNPSSKFIRINLKWFVEVLCFNASGTGPIWESYYEDSILPGGAAMNCRLHLEKMKTWGNEDCSNALLLYHTIFAWLGLSILGAIFTGWLFYLNHKLSVKLTPYPRVSFTGLTVVEAAAMEHLKNLADKMRASKNKFLGVNPSIKGNR